MMDYRQIKAIESKNKERILAVCPTAPELSGIYILTREEGGFRYAYIGQAIKILSRLANHLNGYQHIDLSLKKHGFYSENNPTGWQIEYRLYPQYDLDYFEQLHIKEYANQGFQLRNKTSGSQGAGKKGISENKPPKGYRDGIRQGYLNAQREVAKLFEKNLIYATSEPTNKNKEKAYRKFTTFITLNQEGEYGIAENERDG